MNYIQQVMPPGDQNCSYNEHEDGYAQDRKTGCWPETPPTTSYPIILFPDISVVPSYRPTLEVI